MSEVHGTISLSALDLCQIQGSATPADAIAASITVATHLEALGYSRYWLAEHHGPSSAQSAPEVLLTVLAGVTNTIRVGSAGILVRHYSALKVAKNFALLSTLYPGRIDLGMAGGIADTMRECPVPTAGTESHYHNKVKDLIDLLHRRDPVVNPTGFDMPEIWVISGSRGTAAVAGAAGVGFCLGLSHCGAADDPIRVMTTYRDAFTAHHSASPRSAIAISGRCDASLPVLRPNGGVAGEYRQPVIGPPAYCADRIRELCHRFVTHEVVFVDSRWPVADRLQSYGSLATEIGLRPHVAERTRA